MRGVDPRESLKGFKICLLAFLVNLDRWCVKKATVIFLVVVMSDLELVSYRGLPGHRLSMDPGFNNFRRLSLTIWSLEKADRKSEEGTPEQCKPGTTSLPSLPSPSGNESAVALQDWIEVIDGPLRDISDSSSWWWDAVKERAQERYKKWVASGPYERLALKPPTAEDLEKGKYSRLSARTAGMMLQAMSEAVRTEMAYILQYLVSPPKAQNASEQVTVLRQWERLLLRADNLNIAKPDPSLLVRGLNNLVSELWAKDKDAIFRTQLVKSKLGVDVSPSWETALQLHQHLRAESENLVHGLPTTTRTGKATSNDHYHNDINYPDRKRWREWS
eukprot:s1691_g10.t1